MLLVFQIEWSLSSFQQLIKEHVKLNPKNETLHFNEDTLGFTGADKKNKKKHKNSIFKTFFQNKIHVCLGAIFQLCNLTQARPRISGGIKMLHNFLIENRAGGVETILGPEP